VKHYSEDDLILHFYGEDGSQPFTTKAGRLRRRSAVDEHVDECPECAAVYRELAATLRLIDAPEVPDRGEQYGLEVWQRVRARLPEPEAPWLVLWIRRDRLAATAVVAMLIVAAFAAGHSWSAPGSPAPAPVLTVAPKAAQTAAGVNNDGRQRILLTSVTEHLDRSERILTDIMNAPDGDISTEQRWAADLVSASRLYRQEAADAGEQSVASVLDELERNLLEVVHSPSRMTTAELNDVRRRIDAAALLFKVRVLGDELRQREFSAPPSVPHTRAVTSHVS
jgi:hypothetical protein